MEDASGTYWQGEAYFTTIGGECVIPDEGPSYWAPGIEFIGAVLFHENETRIIHASDGFCDNWMDLAMEAAA